MNCPIKEQCTGSPRGRIIQRSIHQGAIDRNNARVNADPDYYRTRQQIIEPAYLAVMAGRHQFGTIKRQWHFTHALMKGKESVLAEVAIVFTAYNLRRSMSIIGFSVLLERLKALLFNFWANLLLTDKVEHHVSIEMRPNVTYHSTLCHQIRKYWWPFRF